jgi:hypothetical protein
MDDAVGFLGDLIAVLWIALAIAIAVFVVAMVSMVLGPVGRRIEVRLLPLVTRRARAHHGMSPDAPPWACEACGSVNVPTADACYHCRAPRSGDAHELMDAATDPGIFHRPAPANQFDPSLYRGPGAPPPDQPDAMEPSSGEGP